MVIKIAERIKELRTLNQKSQSDLAKILNVTRSSVNAWEMGISIPSTAKIIELANCFGVTTDYLVGISSENRISLNGLNHREKEIILALLETFKDSKTKGAV